MYVTWTCIPSLTLNAILNDEIIKLDLEKYFSLVYRVDSTAFLCTLPSLPFTYVWFDSDFVNAIVKHYSCRRLFLYNLLWALSFTHLGMVCSSDVDVRMTLFFLYFLLNHCYDFAICFLFVCRSVSQFWLTVKFTL